ncbi:uncharacterized protein IWZ02DRAFT_217709 [Phyllosticta citriasiana]|uniref:uncharacterized protein n=1 Tax=Phyllosticta citriasiana TaxID=595635 RepID=UPI0030FD945D
MTTDARGSPPQLLGGTQHLADALSKDPWRRLLESSRVLSAHELSFRDSSATRLASFQSLVRRYTLQLRHGCDNPHCTKPTCFSCVKRLTSKPLRRPTPVSARALAYHLASQDDPESGLCNVIDSPSHWIGSLELRDGWSRRIDRRSFLQNLYSTKVARTLNQTGRVGLASPDSATSGDRAAKIETGFEYLTESGHGTAITSRSGNVEAPCKPISARNTQVNIPLPSRSTTSSTVNGHVPECASPTPNGKANKSAKARAASNEPSIGKLEKSDQRTSAPNGSAGPKANTNGGLCKKINVKTAAIEPPKERHPRHSIAEQKGSAKDLQMNGWPRSKSKFTATHLSLSIMEDLKRLAIAERDDELQIHLPGGIPRYDSDNKKWSFVDESLHQCLSNPKRLLASFRDEIDARLDPLPHLHPVKMHRAFALWQGINGALIFDSLWQSLECLFIPPPELKIRKSSRSKHSKGQRLSLHGDRSAYVPDEDAAHIIMICIYALNALGDKSEYQALLDGEVPGVRLMSRDQLNYEPAVRLATRMARAISARQCFFEMLEKTSETSSRSPIITVFAHIKSSHGLRTVDSFDSDWSWLLNANLRMWLEEILVKTWRGEHEIKRWDAFGSAAECLLAISTYYGPSLEPEFSAAIETSRFKPDLDLVEVIASYCDRRDDPNVRHILEYTFFFPDDTLLTCFRALNFITMSRHFTTAGNNYHIQERFRRHFLNSNWQRYLDEHYAVASSRYLTLDVRRSHVLEDTLNQLWGLERRQLMLPLKVRMGKDEGEQGVDQGGVAQEFFRVALAEAFNPDNGMFTVDPQTHMAWFRPMSPEPLERFELIGLLFSIAICNGITLPVSFPKIFYLRLLKRSCPDPYYIGDGWPELEKSLQFILDCEEEVGDILGRDFVFSIDAGGLIINVNMAAIDEEDELPPLGQILSHVDESALISSPNPTINWPPEWPDAPLVTNENRALFVLDYKDWLTHRSVAPQLAAFMRGFDTCLPCAHLQLLEARPALLQSIVEGHRDVDTRALERVTRYDGGYSAAHETIRAFWAVVHAWDMGRKRKLLEFVTASDRVPVAGVASLMFWIQRNGSDGEQLPTSSTCFGRLLLPQYESREKMERKLIVALDNARGFGAA